MTSADPLCDLQVGDTLIVSTTETPRLGDLVETPAGTFVGWCSHVDVVGVVISQLRLPRGRSATATSQCSAGASERRSAMPRPDVRDRCRGNVDEAPLGPELAALLQDVSLIAFHFNHARTQFEVMIHPGPYGRHELGSGSTLEEAVDRALEAFRAEVWRRDKRHRAFTEPRA